MMRKSHVFSVIALSIAVITPGPAAAAPVSMREAAGKAVLANPDVLAKWHQVKAAGYDRDIVRGRFLPTLDLVLGVAKEDRSEPGATTSGSYTRDGSSITLRQNLFEGMAATNDVKRLEHVALVRYFELLELSESAALEAARAYIDVMRYRKLVEFAEENYATHRVLFEKIKERVDGGVGRRVDLEVATGRLALAESNLLTETANLHDVSARYQRVVGELPKAEMQAIPSLAGGLPSMPADGLKQAFRNAPQMKAAVENILAAQRNVEVQRGNYYPRVDLTAQSSRNRNSEGVSGVTKVDFVELSAKWNMFNGFADQNREKRAAEETNIARDTRDKVCRDVRQTALVALNDVKRLNEKIAFLDQHQLSTDKAREAFRRQFDIGQRTLLDLLDTENEFYEARRAYVNGEHDLQLAQARSHAAMGNLLKSMDIKALEVESLTQPGEVTDEAVLARCPEEAVALTVSDKQAIFERAMARAKLERQNPPAAK